ncbi:Transcriptional regulator, MerR family [hydrothermal vent metagenome]|uniref:Transcriptional regulator, MerR family n=1 Tax=hydrothermal vent metagenome TaxID=652676 RepID=A0A3B0VDT1_9ZZZZ
MQIKTFAQKTSLPPKTIRYYEEIGLLPQPKRLENGYRDYGDLDVNRARFVAGARSLNFSFDDIQEILDLRDRREAPCRVVLELLEEKASEIKQRIAELQRMEAELHELHRLGLTFPTDDVDGKNCVCHLVSEHTETR